MGEQSNQMNPIVQLLAITNTELNASLVDQIAVSSGEGRNKDDSLVGDSDHR